MTDPKKETDKNRDPEEYKRFLEAAKKAEASDDPKDFDRVAKLITTKPKASRKSS